jgi:hypothetical protein
MTRALNAGEPADFTGGIVVTVQKGEEGFERLSAVCIPLKYQDGGYGRFPAVIQVEQFDIPDWGDADGISLREGMTVAVATNGRKLVAAQTICLEQGQYRPVKMTEKEIVLERLEPPVRFINWRALFTGIMEDGRILSDEAGAAVPKTWVVSNRITPMDSNIWASQILYSFAAEGMCVDANFIERLVYRQRGCDNVHITVPRDKGRMAAMHFPRLVAIVQTLGDCAGVIYKYDEPSPEAQVGCCASA